MLVGSAVDIKTDDGEGQHPGEEGAEMSRGGEFRSFLAVDVP